MRPFYTLGFLILPFFSSAQTPTIISNHVIAGNCSALAYGNGLYVASAGQLFTSPNARTWTVLNDSVPAFALLAFGNGVLSGLRLLTLLIPSFIAAAMGYTGPSRRQ